MLLSPVVGNISIGIGVAALTLAAIPEVNIAAPTVFDLAIKQGQGRGLGGEKPLAFKPLHRLTRFGAVADGDTAMWRKLAIRFDMPWPR